MDPTPPLILVDGGSLVAIELLRTGWGIDLRIGLFANVWDIRRDSTIAEVVPAYFSGYAGLLPIMGFGSPYLLGDVAVMDSPMILWAHDGGPIASWVNGYYVVDLAGELLWAQRNVEAVSISVLGQSYGVAPQFALTSRFHRSSLP